MQVEDAAVILSDFVSSLDNLPAEVHHILQEIGHKEARVIDLKNRAQSRDAAIQKHARPSHQGGAGLLTVNPKEEGSIVKIRSDLERAEAISREKVALTERGVALLSRHLSRLNAQLEHVDAAIPPVPSLPSFAPAVAVAGPPASMNYGAYQGTPSQYSSYGAYSNASPYIYPALQKRASSSLVSGMSHIPSAVSTPGSSGYATPGGSRRIAAQQQVQSQHQQQQQQQPQKHRLSQVFPAPPANMTPEQQRQFAAQQVRYAQQQQQLLHQQALLQQQAAAQYGGHQQHSSLHAGVHHHSQQQQQSGRKRKYARAAEDDDEDEDDELVNSRSGAATAGDENGDGDDNTPYCFCNRPSFGEMIGCDAEDCEIEWFHLSCVGLKTTPSGSWYCANCEPKVMAQKAAAQGRRGRKQQQ